MATVVVDYEEALAAAKTTLTRIKKWRGQRVKNYIAADRERIIASSRRWSGYTFGLVREKTVREATIEATRHMCHRIIMPGGPRSFPSFLERVFEYHHASYELARKIVYHPSSMHIVNNQVTLTLTEVSLLSL